MVVIYSWPFNCGSSLFTYQASNPDSMELQTRHPFLIEQQDLMILKHQIPLGIPGLAEFIKEETQTIIDMQLRVSIVGAGPAGFALAADLESHGTRVLVYSHPTHFRHAQSVLDKGCLKSSGAIEGATNPRVTLEMSKVVEFSRIIILTVPSTGHNTVLEELKKFDLRLHTIIAIPGNLMALTKEADLNAGNILETNLSPYSCRMTNDGELSVSGKKSLFYIAPLRDLKPAISNTISAIFPMQLHWCANVVEVSLSNINGVFHPLMMLLNIGRIESTGGDFLLYRDGLTRSTAKAITSLDKVRLQIGEAFGFHLDSVLETSNRCYGQHFTDLVDLARHSPPHNKLRAPAEVRNRNISEDVPNLLVTWLGLAEKLGIDAAPIRAVITLSEMITGEDYLETGRNLRQLQLDHLSKEELLERFSAVPRRG